MRRLPAADVSEIEKHVGECSECAGYLRDIETMIRVLRAAAEQDEGG